MPERRDTNLFEILIGQVTQNLEVNIILGKALSVLPEPELFEPVRNLLHRRPSSDLALSVLDWHVAKFTNAVGVALGIAFAFAVSLFAAFAFGGIPIH